MCTVLRAADILRRRLGIIDLDERRVVIFRGQRLRRRSHHAFPFLRRPHAALPTPPRRHLIYMLVPRKAPQNTLANQPASRPNPLKNFATDLNHLPYRWTGPK
ncbi:MAG TPA: hypothetical protein DCP73_08445 [Chloroflexi bacterium]|nr:hypothetical protein [Chloroflexota bacterium]